MRKFCITIAVAGMVGCASAPLKIPLQYPPKIEMQQPQKEKTNWDICPLSIHPEGAILYDA